MKQKLLSVLLVLAMALTMLPTAAFAEETGKTDPVVAGYGFLWESPKDGTNLTGGFKPGIDWMGETMYVAFAENGLAANTNLWFEVTAGSDVWGCAATADGTHNMFAFSFLNRTTQWEQVPNGITVGESQTHADKYLADKNVNSVTLKVYVTESAFTSESHDVSGLTPFFTKSVTITSGKDTMEVEGNTSVDTPAITATTATLHDTRTEEEGAIADADLCKNYKLDTTATGTIKIMAADLREHQNGDTPETMGYWVGISFAPADGYTLKYKDKNGEFQADAEDGKVNYYWNAKNYLSTGATVTLASFQGEKQVGEEVTYKIDFSGVTLYEAPPTAGTLTFSTLLDAEVADGKIFGKAPSSLGKFEVTEGTGADAGKITVTGTANYISGWTEFNGDTTAKENDGHYLPIQIKGVNGQKITIKGANEKTLTFGEDGSLELVMFLDKLTESTFTVTVGEVETSSKKAGDVYTIDLSGVTLLPKAGNGTKVEATTDAEGNTTIKASDTDEKVTVTLPAETAEGLTGNTIKVENKTSFSDKDMAENTDKAVSDVVKTASVGAAVTVTDSEGKEVEVTGEAVITITIKVTEAGTYHVFCIDNDGKVTSFGEYTATEGEKTLTIKSKHLSQYPAVKITDENRAAVDAAAKLAGQDEGKVDGDTPVTPGSIVVNSVADSGAIGRKVTVTGLTAGNVTVQIAKPGNTAPAVVFNIPKATAVNGFNVNAGSVVTVWDGVVTFVNGAPSNPPAASAPYTVPANG